MKAPELISPSESTLILYDNELARLHRLLRERPKDVTREWIVEKIEIIYSAMTPRLYVEKISN